MMGTVFTTRFCGIYRFPHETSRDDKPTSPTLESPKTDLFSLEKALLELSEPSAEDVPQPKSGGSSLGKRVKSAVSDMAKGVKDTVAKVQPSSSIITKGDSEEQARLLR